MKKFLFRYKWFILIFLINLIVGLLFPEIGKQSFINTKHNFIEVVSVLPPIFILLGLLDVWIERSTMVKYLGKGSGLKGFGIALLLGSVAAGPLYAAFPIALVLLKKRASLFNVFVFVGAWSTTKIPMLTFEIANLGYKFGLLRLACSLIGIVIIASILCISINDKDRDKIYSNADNVI